MACNHRFINELFPDWTVDYLFIGTFNPSSYWDEENGNNANYFYGRGASLFWCILPHSFNKNCLIDKNREEWINFCRDNKIGITDIIKNIPNADISNDNHKSLIKGFNDGNLEKKDINGNYIFNIDFNTNEIIKYIEENKIKNIFFTRKSFTNIPRIKAQWDLIKNRFNNDDYNVKELLTPSQQGRDKDVRKKINQWKTCFFLCLNNG